MILTFGPLVIPKLTKYIFVNLETHSKVCIDMNRVAFLSLSLVACCRSIALVRSVRWVELGTDKITRIRTVLPNVEKTYSGMNKIKNTLLIIRFLYLETGKCIKSK